MESKNIKYLIFGLIFSIFISLGLIWKNEISSLVSIREIMPENKAHQDGKVMYIDMKGDYYFDDLLKNGGVKSDKELIDFATKKITKGLFDISIEESDIGCSSFTARLKDGENIFARNYDMKETHIALVHTKPKGHYESISTVDLSFLGVEKDDDPNSLKSKINMLAAPYTPLDGINEKGLAVGVYMSYQGPGEEDYPTDQNSEKDDITSTTLLRLFLDRAASVDEAVELAKSFDMHDSANSSFHYMVADVSGKSAILEYLGESDKTDTDGSKRKLRVIYSDGKDGQVVTNFILAKAYYGKDDKKFGLDRYELLKNELKKKDYKLKNEDEAMELLSKVGRRTWDNDDDNAITTHSVIYKLGSKESFFIANEHYGDKDYEYRHKFTYN